MDLDLDLVRQALGDNPSGAARDQSEGGTDKRASVAAVLRQGRAGLEALFIRRAQHQDDPWSGHMAFPGGRHQQGDASSLATAIRETQEEVGIDLHRAEHLGDLPRLSAVARGRRTDLTILPHVFALSEPVELVCDPREVAAALWLPLDPMFLDECRTTWTVEHDHTRYTLPAFEVQGCVIWGLTFQMLGSLFEAFRRARG